MKSADRSCSEKARKHAQQSNYTVQVQTNIDVFKCKNVGKFLIILNIVIFLNQTSARFHEVTSCLHTPCCELVIVLPGVFINVFVLMLSMFKAEILKQTLT
ncbi:hypothetical protein XENORESO_017952 [Xenotaenia resolanae]|uniref:Uncharacterized protein n=1 Tax=Xenotaenia resolanae TaxID=208358 RepID=A0ABV0VU41_9TELE